MYLVAGRFSRLYYGQVFGGEVKPWVALLCFSQRRNGRHKGRFGDNEVVERN